MTEYQTNRPNISLDELKKYENEWVAIGMDGTTIIGHAPTLTELDERLIAAGVDPESIGYERVEFEDSYLGGAEFH